MKGEGTQGTGEVCLSFGAQIGHPLQWGGNFGEFELRLATMCFCFKESSLAAVFRLDYGCGLHVGGRVM